MRCVRLTRGRNEQRLSGCGRDGSCCEGSLTAECAATTHARVWSTWCVFQRRFKNFADSDVAASTTRARYDMSARCARAHTHTVAQWARAAARVANRTSIAPSMTVDTFVVPSGRRMEPGRKLQYGTRSLPGLGACVGRWWRCTIPPPPTGLGAPAPLDRVAPAAAASRARGTVCPGCRGCAGVGRCARCRWRCQREESARLRVSAVTASEVCRKLDRNSMRTKRHYTEYIPSRVGSHSILSLCPPPATRGTAAAGSTLSLAPKRRPSQLVALDKDRVMVETAMRLDGSHGRSCFVGEGLARRLPLLSVLFVSFFGLSCMCVFECVWDVCLCWAAQGGGTRRPRLETSLGQIWAPA